MKFKEFIVGFVDEAKKDIAELAETELTNENKKLALDHQIIGFIDNALENLTLNFILKFALKKLLLPNVSVITQLIFDLLKAKIKGVTK